MVGNLAGMVEARSEAFQALDGFFHVVADTEKRNIHALETGRRL